jgi:hypothetical protein
VTTHVLNLQFQLLLSSLGGTLIALLIMNLGQLMGLSNLESEMLKEVGGTVVLVSLSSGTGIDPDTDGRRLRKGRVLGSDLMVAIVRGPFRNGSRSQLASGDDAHSQSILKSCSLSLADSRGSGKASCERSGGRKPSTVSQASREVQSQSPGRHDAGLEGRR